MPIGEKLKAARWSQMCRADALKKILSWNINTKMK